MSTRRRRSSTIAAALLLGVAWLIAPDASANTSQFRGVNWADSRDNFQSGVLHISGLSSSDTYNSALAVGTAIMDQFISKLGANAVRIPINEATVSQYWSTYTGAIDAVLAKGKLVFCYWDSAKSNKPPDMNAWWNMWKTVVDKYVENENAYFEIFNEPNMYSKTDLGNLYNDWLTRYPTVPKGRVILDGTGNAQNVSDVGSDSRLRDCLLAVHDYSFFGSESMTKESDWENHIKGEVGSYSERTVCTEWGGPMSPGSKNGKSYDYLDYSKSPTNYFEGYIRGISNQLRSWNMGSFYWPGLRDGDWYSMTIKSGSGANITLSIPNKSGLDRLQYAWGGVSPGTGGAGGGTGGRTGGSDAGAGGMAGGGAGGRDGGTGGSSGSSDAGAGGAAAGGGGGRGGADGGLGGSTTMSSGGAAGGGTGGTNATGRGGSAGSTTTSGGSGGVSASGGAASGGRSGTGGTVAGTGGTTNAGQGGSVSSGGNSSGSSGSGGATGPSSVENRGESGCSCGIGQAPRGSGAGLVLLLAALALAARRRPPIKR
jgi:MYXO-CTERM domain-containing protein